MSITIVGETCTYRATPEPSDLFVGIDRLWRMELVLNERQPDLTWEEFDRYFTSDVFDLAAEELAPAC